MAPHPDRFLARFSFGFWQKSGFKNVRNLVSDLGHNWDFQLKLLRNGLAVARQNRHFRPKRNRVSGVPYGLGRTPGNPKGATEIVARPPGAMRTSFETPFGLPENLTFFPKIVTSAIS